MSTMTRDPLIVVLTCDRPAACYLPTTIAQIDREGGRLLQRRIYVDGPGEALERIQGKLAGGELAGWEQKSLGAQYGSTEAMRRVLADAAGEGLDVLFFEDDLLLCKNAVARMAAQQVPPQASLVTFFDMKEVAAGASFGMYFRPPTGADHQGLWGCQCLRIPADVVQWLAEKDWRGTVFGGLKMGSDVILGELLLRHPGRGQIAVHIPCLVEHVGESSACFPGIGLPGWRRATNFPGQDFDASTLPR